MLFQNLIVFALAAITSQSSFASALPTDSALTARAIPVSDVTDARLAKRFEYSDIGAIAGSTAVVGGGVILVEEGAKMVLECAGIDYETKCGKAVAKAFNTAFRAKKIKNLLPTHNGEAAVPATREITAEEAIAALKKLGYTFQMAASKVGVMPEPEEGESSKKSH